MARTGLFRETFLKLLGELESSEAADFTTDKFMQLGQVGVTKSYLR